jgi:Beta-lactamase
VGARLPYRPRAAGACARRAARRPGRPLAALDPRRPQGPARGVPRQSIRDARDEVVNSAAYRGAEVPAVNGHGTARSIAHYYGGLADGGELDGVKLLRSEIVDDALRPHARGYDELLEEEASWGLGFRVDDADTFGLGGIGGFAGFGICRPGLALGYGYVTCLLAGRERTAACEDALDAVLPTLT